MAEQPDPSPPTIEDPRNYPYPREYFVGGKVSGDVDYAETRGILETWAVMLDDVFHPTSVLD